MAKRLFVGGLSWDTTSEGLREAFDSFGEISDAVVVSDRETGRSRGFGFVTFVNDEDGNTAVNEMDGKELDGRSVRVNEAHERSSRGGAGGGGGGERGGGGGGGGGAGRRRW